MSWNRKSMECRRRVLDPAQRGGSGCWWVCRERPSAHRPLEVLWRSLAIRGNPSPRDGADLVHDPFDGYLVLFGGEGPTSPPNDALVVSTSLSGASSALSGTNGTTGFYSSDAGAGVAAVAVRVLLLVME